MDTTCLKRFFFTLVSFLPPPFTTPHSPLFNPPPQPTRRTPRKVLQHLGGIGAVQRATSTGGRFNGSMTRPASTVPNGSFGPSCLHRSDVWDIWSPKKTCPTKTSKPMYRRENIVLPGTTWICDKDVHVRHVCAKSFTTSMMKTTLHSSRCRKDWSFTSWNGAKIMYLTSFNRRNDLH